MDSMWMKHSGCVVTIYGHPCYKGWPVYTRKAQTKLEDDEEKLQGGHGEGV